MHRYSHIFVLLSVTLVSKTSSDLATENLQSTESVNSFDKRQGGYSNSDPNNVSPYQYEYNGYQSQYSNEVSQNYKHNKNTHDISDPFSSTVAERQDIFGGDSAIAIGLAALAGVAAGAALVWNTQQTSNSDFDDLKARVSSLESDQTSICTAVKSVVTADDGLADIDLGSYSTGSTGEAQWITNVAAVASPTCS